MLGRANLSITSCHGKQKGEASTHKCCEGSMETTCPDTLLGVHQSSHSQWWRGPMNSRPPHLLHYHQSQTLSRKHLNGCDTRLDAIKWPHQPSMLTEPASRCGCGTNPWPLTGPKEDPRGTEKYLCRSMCEMHHATKSVTHSGCMTRSLAPKALKNSWTKLVRAYWSTVLNTWASLVWATIARKHLCHPWYAESRTYSQTSAAFARKTTVSNWWKSHSWHAENVVRAATTHAWACWSSLKQIALPQPHKWFGR